jgi:hypothetical protein
MVVLIDKQALHILYALLKHIQSNTGRLIVIPKHIHMVQGAIYNN